VKASWRARLLGLTTSIALHLTTCQDGKRLLKDYSGLEEKEDEQRCYLYVITWRQRGPCKIGIAGTPLERLRGLQGANPYELKIAYLWLFNSVDAALKAEQGALFDAKAVRLKGEWVNLTMQAANKLVSTAIRRRGLSCMEVDRHSKKKKPASPSAEIERARRAMAEYHRLNRE
jgi:hypothetical protein